jgi:predicted aldo/keto reductase-like oxidoreductase
MRELSPGEIHRFMEKAGDAGKGFCRNCGYCLPCPEGVPIPDIFRYESYSLQYGLDGWAKAQYAALSTNAQACSECRQCLDRCPYAVAIPSGLKNAHKILKGAFKPFYA